MPYLISHIKCRIKHLFGLTWRYVFMAIWTLQNNNKKRLQARFFTMITPEYTPEIKH